MEISKYLKEVVSKEEKYDLFDLLTDADKEENRLIAEISSMIIKRRKELNMSQSQLAQLLEVKQPMISQWESGEYNYSISTIAKIFDALNLKIAIEFIDNFKSVPLFLNAPDYQTLTTEEAA